MFAEGVFSADGQRIEWYTGLSGQPTPLSSLSGPARIQAESLLNDRLDAVRSLARGLKDRGDADGAELLRLAAATPDPASVYMVGGQPVITSWGREGAAAPLAAAAPVPPPVAAATAIPAAAITTAAVATATRRRWGPLLGLAGLLLLIALAAGLFGLRSCQTPQVPVAGGDDSDALKQQEAQLRAEMAGLEKALADRLAACPVPAPPPADTTQPPPDTKADIKPAPPEDKPALPPEPKAKTQPKPEPKQKPEPQPKPQPLPAPKTTAKAEPTPPPPSKCPPPRPKWKAPEVAILLDASGSMGLPAGMQQQEVNDLIRRVRQGDPAARSQLQGMLSGRGGPSRLDAAKSAIHRTVGAMPADVDVGLVAFGECSGTDNYKFFSAKERGNLFSVVDGMQPRHGTPLARGLERAGNMVNGVDVPATLVVVSDGDDSCGGDPCAVARQLKARKPQLKINVVDLDGDGAGACMAQATGGQVFSAGSVGDFNRTMQDATGQPAVPAECRN